jgi:hypothetical protein
MEKDGEMNMRKFGMYNQAVAGVIEALLLVAMVAIIISMIQLVYIPQVMEQKESEHMDQVFNQFSSLKSMVDLQAITRSSAPISSMITLGSRELPYFITAKAFGTLSTDEDNNYKIVIETPPYPALPFKFSPTGNTTPLTSIKYEADNSYFTDQSYILEGGGIIVEQPDGSPVMRADPSISAENMTSTITIHFDLPHVVAIAGKNSANGEGKCFIRTNYSSNMTHVNNNISYNNPVVRLRIYTKYPNAWNESLHNLLGIYDTNGYLHINWVSTQPINYIEITPGSKDIDLQLNVINIYVQIGQGWVL